MAFRARWCELNKAGWTSKRPTGLSVDFTYLKPGKSKKDKRGVDFFAGENELMLYLDAMDRAHDTEELQESPVTPRRGSPRPIAATAQSGDVTWAVSPHSMACEETASDEEETLTGESTPNGNQVGHAQLGFAVLESDAENDDGEDDKSSEDVLDDLDVELPVPPERKFDDDFISRLVVWQTYLPEQYQVIF
ncbi:hypothetical protein PInf_004143 [Phytophthora infestans]|nr:hypothetical protein PInf_004143 [Phytophthora infestans]